MREFIRRVFSRLYRIPLVGYFLSLFVGIVTLPALRQRINLAEQAAHNTATSVDDRDDNIIARLGEHLRNLDAEVKGLALSSTAQSGQLMALLEAETDKIVNEGLADLQLSLDALAQKHQEFEQHGLPNLLASITDINARLVATNAEWDNLVKSVPVSIRDITRAQAEMKSQVLALIKEQKSIQQHTLANEDGLLGCDKTISTLKNKNDSAFEKVTQELTVHNENIAFLLRRVEFVRREMMYEQRYQASLNEPPQSIVVNKDKLAEFRRTGLKLNLGCGPISLPDYLNIDMRQLPGVDIVAEINDLPFELGEIQEIYAAHLLEHFPYEQLKRKILPYLNGLLSPQGQLRIVVPDIESMMHDYVASPSDGSFQTLREVVYGAQDYDGDFHYTMFSKDSMQSLLRESGFSMVELTAFNRKNGLCKELEVVAKKRNDTGGSREASEEVAATA